jgi:hypothetical protein
VEHSLSITDERSDSDSVRVELIINNSGVDNGLFTVEEEEIVRQRVDAFLERGRELYSSLCQELGRAKWSVMARWHSHLINSKEGMALEVPKMNVQSRPWQQSEVSRLAALIQQHQRQKKSQSTVGSNIKTFIDWTTIGTALDRDSLDCRLEYHCQIDKANPFTSTQDTTIMQRMTARASEVRELWIALSNELGRSEDDVRQWWHSCGLISQVVHHQLQ